MPQHTGSTIDLIRDFRAITRCDLRRAKRWLDGFATDTGWDLEGARKQLSQVPTPDRPHYAQLDGERAQLAGDLFAGGTFVVPPADDSTGKWARFTQLEGYFYPWLRTEGWVNPENEF